MNDDTIGTAMLAFVAGLVVCGVGMGIHAAAVDPYVVARGINEIKRVEIGKDAKLESCDYEVTPSNANVRITFTKEGK